MIYSIICVIFVLNKKNIEIMTRLQSLRNRREKLIEANQLNNYTQSSNPKIEKYYHTLLAIKKEINEIECVNVRPAKAKVGMTVKELFNLNKN